MLMLVSILRFILNTSQEKNKMLYSVEWDSGMMAYFFWDELDMKQGYWENKEDAQEAFENYKRKSN